ncbi:DUF6507 family protein [Streptomyces sp. NPDC049555]|uniref:DUF6507 family protein n=1 Tax=unclassified Streptomyces TaxID=2593676 RepID=UPI00341EF63C
MGKWDIDVGGVNSVLSATGEVAGKLEGQFTSYSTNMEHAGTHAGTIAAGGKAPEGGGGLVAVALAEFAQKTKGDLQFIAARTGKSMKGAVEATKAYVHGDEQMAQDAQNNAIKAPTPEELKGKQGQQDDKGQQGKGTGKA